MHNLIKGFNIDFFINTDTLKKRFDNGKLYKFLVYAKKNISAKNKKTHATSWFFGADEHGWRKKSCGSSTKTRKKTTYGIKMSKKARVC